MHTWCRRGQNCPNKPKKTVQSGPKTARNGPKTAWNARKPRKFAKVCGIFEIFKSWLLLLRNAKKKVSCVLIFWTPPLPGDFELPKKKCAFCTYSARFFESCVAKKNRALLAFFFGLLARRILDSCITFEQRRLLYSSVLAITFSAHCTISIILWDFHRFYGKWSNKFWSYSSRLLGSFDLCLLSWKKWWQKKA